ncbi:YbaB/EbfC family DNA-binding protein [Mycobacterium sp. PS03-16]|uniref:YbaB/EbfC family DNA-binding protein n=1 Tax=Mycobacterium sp. PS03-16 TaxID=2559611 RepID=UPI00107444B4|nr:YbaB/EbfC family DNA-binding protein [Mycobacterium sp. PS03-16]TFV54355.1 YbaB/EbfC family DNA-binding protein [Mycobacterium sp. PS03-16]
MVGDTSPYDPSDGHDDLSGLDFSYPAAAGDPSDDSGLAAFDDYAPPLPSDAGDAGPLFTVTNPPGTVTVTTHLDGGVQHIALTPRVTNMSETELAEEIVVIAGLATQDARSAQYEVMLDGMRRQGHDDPATRDFLQRDLDLPTPEEAQARRAEVFTTRYADSHE